MTEVIVYSPLSRDQKEFCLSHIRESSSILKSWALTLLGPKKTKKFREQIFQAHRKGEDLKNLVKKPLNSCELHNFQNQIKKVLDIRTKPYDNLDNRTIELAVLAGYSKLAEMHARRWTKHRFGNGVIGQSDFEQEAYLVVINAIYGYYRKDIDFSTYLWNSLKNRLSQVNNNAEPFCPLTNSDRKLLTTFQKAKAQANKHVTFDEIAEALGLSEQQYLVVSKMLAKVYTESQIPDDQNNSVLQNRVKNDYTALREDVNQRDYMPECNVSDLIVRAGLTIRERQTIDAYVEADGQRGWQSELSRKLGLSRERVKQLYQAAQAKLQAVYHEVA